MKKFFIWLSWHYEKKPRNLSILFMILCYALFSLITIDVFKILESIDNSSKLMIGLVVGMSFFLIIAISVNFWKKKERNWRVAIEIAKEFNKKHSLEKSWFDLHENLCGIYGLISKTKETKDPTKMLEWMNDCKKFIYADERWKNLMQEARDIRNGVTLKKITEKIKEEEDKLAKLNPRVL